MSQTLLEVSRERGIPLVTLKKHVQRGKLLTRKDGNRVVVDDESLAAYLASESIAKVAETTRGQPMEAVTEGLGSLIQKLPQEARDEILRRITTERPKGRQVAPAPVAAPAARTAPDSLSDLDNLLR